MQRRLRYEASCSKYGSLDRLYLEHELSKGHLSQILRGKTDPKLSTIAKLANVLGVDAVEPSPVSLLRPATP